MNYVGNSPIDRASTTGTHSYTYVDRVVSAPITGKVTIVELYAPDVATAVRVASFYVVSGLTLATRSWADVPNIAAGYNIFSGLNISFNAGDFIGIQATTGTGGWLDSSTTAGGCNYKNAKVIPTAGVLFTSINALISLRGTFGGTKLYLGGLPSAKRMRPLGGW